MKKIGNIIGKTIHGFVFKEAMASVALSKDDAAQTICEGLLHNEKLHRIGVKVTDRNTGDIIWRGSVAQVCNQMR